MSPFYEICITNNSVASSVKSRSLWCLDNITYFKHNEIDTFQMTHTCLIRSESPWPIWSQDHTRTGNVRRFGGVSACIFNCITLCAFHAYFDALWLKNNCQNIYMPEGSSGQNCYFWFGWFKIKLNLEINGYRKRTRCPWYKYVSYFVKKTVKSW